VLAEKQRLKLPVPPAVQRVIETYVEPLPHLRYDLDAFWYLNRLRTIHFGGVGYIPEQEILSYALLRGLPLGSEILDDLIRNVRTLDEEYMLIRNEEQAAAEKAKPKSREI
jgi:hypothetical protein